jgi:thioredoxin-related protein
MDKFNLLLILGVISLGLYALANTSGTVSGTPSNGPSWLTSAEAARVESLKTGKPILADFTGSDWCGWCIKLKDEVFNTVEFEEWAAENVVLLELDFPRSKPQSSALKSQNEKLAKQYYVRGFPTIIFLNADGKVLGRLSYKPGGPANWIAAADKQLDAVRKG